MKKAFLLATTGIALLLAGCSNGNSSASKSSDSGNAYKTEMAKGNNAVDDKEYSKAADHFDSAVKAKKTDKAHDSKLQAQNLVKAKRLMNQRKFSSAQSALNKVTEQDNGNKKMVSYAKKLTKQVKKIQFNRSNFKANIKNAKSLIKQGANDQAKALLEQVTTFKGVKGKYYSDLYTQANTLLKSLPADSKDSTNTDSNTNNDSSTTTTDNNSSDNSSNNSSADQSNNPAAQGGDFNIEKKEVNGKAITDDDIAKARQQLSDAGVKNVDAWSDNDIVRAIKNAAKDGRSTVTADDGKIQ